jgi:hypothetical protein
VLTLANVRGPLSCVLLLQRQSLTLCVGATGQPRMKFTRYIAPSLLGLAVGAVWLATCAMNVGYAVAGAGTDPAAQTIAIGAAVGLDLLKALGLGMAAAAWARRSRCVAVAAAIIWLCALGASGFSVFSGLTTSAADATAARSNVVVSGQALQAELDSAVQRLGWLNARVKDVKGRDLDRVSADYVATAAKVSTLRDDIKNAGAMQSSTPVSDFLKRHFGVDLDTTALWKILAAVAILELIASLGPAVVRDAWQAGRVVPSTVVDEVATSATLPLALPSYEVAIGATNAAPSTAEIATSEKPAVAEAVTSRTRGSPNVAITAAVPVLKISRPALTLVPKVSLPAGYHGNLALDLDDTPDFEMSIPAIKPTSVDLPMSIIGADVSHPAAAFAATHIERRVGASIQASVLFAAYAAWRQRHGQEPGTINAFGAAMSELGFAKVKSSRVHYLDIAFGSEAAA